MPFPHPHHLLSFGGPHWGTDEWSCGLRLSRRDPYESDAAQNAALAKYAEAIRLAWTDSTSPLGALQSPLTWVKLNRIGLDGRYTSQKTYAQDLVAASSGSNAPYPPQVAMVATLETGAVRGLAHRGRIFLPSPILNISLADGHIPAATREGRAVAVASMIMRINDVEPFVSVIVGSQTREGALRYVNGVTIGSVLDTMRSRREQIREERTSAPVLPPSSGFGGAF